MIEEPVVSVAMHLLEGLVPAGSCLSSRPNEQLSLLNNEIDRSVQLTLLNDGFRNSDSFRIPDSYDVCLHLFLLLTPMIYSSCNYIVPMDVVNKGAT